MVMTDSPIDRRALDRLEKLGGSELIVRVIDQYLDKVPQRMEAACDRGRAGDLNAVGRAVHSIKSAAGNVGATEVSDFADRIERAAIDGAKDLILPLLCQLDDMLGQVETWLQREKSSLRSARGINWH
jgi:HPt (histidine-containing phosphotransfer) domain-containing protein